jgi:hypothetical protein
MDLENQLHNSAMKCGVDYFGIADLFAAKDTILEQGGTEIAEYPRSISIGIALFQTIVNQLPRRQEKAVAVKMQHLSQPEKPADPKGRAADFKLYIINKGRLSDEETNYSWSGKLNIVNRVRGDYA